MDTQKRAEPQTFTQFLHTQGKGKTHSDLTDELTGLIGAVVTHGKKGSLTIKIDVSPHADGMVTTTTSFVTKAPTPASKPSMWFANESGQFSRDRLDQPKLPFSAVEGGRGSADEQDRASEGATS